MIRAQKLVAFWCVIDALSQLDITDSVEDCYVTLYPCSQCAASLINAGIKNVYVPGDVEIPDRWLENFTLALGLFREAGVNFLTIDIS